MPTYTKLYNVRAGYTKSERMPRSFLYFGDAAEFCQKFLKYKNLSPKYQNILEHQDGKFVLTNKITDKNIGEMIINMDEQDSAAFREFVKVHWNCVFNERGERLA